MAVINLNDTTFTKDGKNYTFESDPITGNLVLTQDMPTSTEFISGPEFNTIIDKKMGSFIRLTEPPSEDKIVEDISSKQDGSIVTYFDGNIQYWYSDADIVYLNSNSSYMFKECRLLVMLDPTSFNWSKVTNMDSMFSYCEFLPTIALMDVSGVTNINNLFENCMGLTSIDVSVFDITKFTTLNRVFKNCPSLASLDLSSWDTSNITSMVELFMGCTTPSLTINYGENFVNTGFDPNSLKTNDQNNATYGMYTDCFAPKAWTDENSYWFKNGTYRINSIGIKRTALGTTINNKIRENFNSITNIKYINDLNDLETSYTMIDISENNNYDVVAVESYGTLAISAFGNNVVLNPDSSHLFEGLGDVGSFDINSLDFSEITNAEAMFKSVSVNGSIYSLDISNWNTSNVTNMKQMFWGFAASHSNPSSININYGNNFNYNSLDFNGVDNPTFEMFLNTSITKPTWDGTWDANGTFAPVISEPKKLMNSKDINSNVFKGKYDAITITEIRCTDIVPINADTTDISEAQDGSVVSWYDSTEKIVHLSAFGNIMVLNRIGSYLFADCYALRVLDLSKIDFSEVVEAETMFGFAAAQGYLSELDLSSWDTSNVTNMRKMFWGFCAGHSNPSSVNVKYGSNFNNNALNFDSEINPTTEMFLESMVTKPTWDGTWDANGTFTPDANIVNTLLPGRELNDILTQTSIREFKKSTTAPSPETEIVDISENQDNSVVSWLFLDTEKTTENGQDYYIRYWYSDNKITLNPDGRSTFKDLNLVSLNVDEYDNVKLTDMTQMFANLVLSTPLDLSSWDVSNNTSLYYTFEGSGISNINCAGWDTSKVNTMTHCFSSYVDSVNLSGWRILNNCDCSYMFMSCRDLTSLDLSTWDTSGMHRCAYMFQGCRKLTNLDLSSWDTSNVDNMVYMFKYCELLENINYGDNFVNTAFDELGLEMEFDTANGGFEMFNGCLETLTKPNWTPGSYNENGTYYIPTLLLKTGEELNNLFDKTMIEFKKSSTAPTEGIATTDITKYNTGTAITWFDDTSKIQYWYADSMYIYAYIGDGSKTFMDCSLLTNVDLTGMKIKLETQYMFKNCTSLENVTYTDKFITFEETLLEKLTIDNPTYEMYHNCNSLVNKPDNWTEEDGTYTVGGTYTTALAYTTLLPGPELNKIFNKSMKYLNVSYDTPPENAVVISQGTTPSIVYTWYDDVSFTQYIRYIAVSASYSNIVYFNPDCSNMFKDFTELLTVAFNIASSTKFDYVETMAGMFDGCLKLNSITATSPYTPNLKNTSAMYRNCTSLNNISFLEGTDTINVTDMSYMFAGTGLTTNPPSIKTDSCINMSHMFEDCIKYDTSYSYSGWITTNVTDMSYMFKGCIRSDIISINAFDTTSVTNMRHMFDGCTVLDRLDISTTLFSNSGMDSSKFVDYTEENPTYHMFANCDVLPNGEKPLWLNGEWNSEGTFGPIVPRPKNLMNGQSLNQLLKSKYDATRASEIRCTDIVPSDVTTTDISLEKDGSVVSWYDTTTKTIHLSAFGNIMVLNTNSSYLFADFYALKVLDLSKMDFSEIRETEAMFGFAGASGYLSELDISNWDTSNVTDMTTMFWGFCSGHSDPANVNINYGDNFNYNSLDFTADTNPTFEMFLDTRITKPTWNGTWDAKGTFTPAPPTPSETTGSKINENINREATSFMKASSMSQAPETAVDISTALDRSVLTWYDTESKTQYWYSDTPVKIKDASNLFKDCTKLTNIDINWDFSENVSMEYMFSNCTSLVTVIVADIDTSNVTKMFGAFDRCNSIYSLDLSMWDVSKVDYNGFDFMFKDCVNLRNVNLSGWTNENVNSVQDMFLNCTSLTDVILTDFNTSNITQMQGMFYNCPALTTLDISSFDTSNVMNTYDMFYNCTALATITYGANFVNTSLDLTTEPNPTETMFYNCPANKPTLWSNGTWDSEGTFISS